MKPVRLALCLGLVVLTAAFVQAQPDEKGKGKGKGRNPFDIGGVVEKVDGNNITIKTGRRNDPEAKSVTIAVNSDTKYFVGGRRGELNEAKLSDLTEAKRIGVRKKTIDGKDVATEIFLLQQPFDISGVVEKVDGNNITIKTGRRTDPEAKSLTIAVNSDTKYFIRSRAERKEANLSDITEKKAIGVKKKPIDGKDVATEITILQRLREPGAN